MPRRNNRKHYRYEGELGFNPDKYISGSGYLGYSPQRPAVCTEKAGRPASSRHKARKKTAKYRRAWNDIRQMQQTAERVRIPHTLPLELRTPVKSEQKPLTGETGEAQKTEQATLTPEQKNTTTIIGGIKNWIRTILHA